MECSLKNNSTALSGAEKYIFSLETNWQISFRTRCLLQAECCTCHLMHEPKALVLWQATTSLRHGIWTGRPPKHKTCPHCSQLGRQAFPWIKMQTQVAGSHFLSHPLPTSCHPNTAVQPCSGRTAACPWQHCCNQEHPHSRASLCPSPSSWMMAASCSPTQAESEAFLDWLTSDSFMCPIKTALSFRLLVWGGAGG